MIKIPEPEQVATRYANSPCGKHYKWVGVDAEGATLYTHEPDLMEFEPYNLWDCKEGDYFVAFQHPSPEKTEPYKRKLR